jgi:hypothetical protein
LTDVTDSTEKLLALLNSQGRQLHRLLFRLTLREDVAEDLLQELFTDLVYDARLDPALFSLRPPAGYTVTTHGLAELPPPPDIKLLLAPEAKPGVGLGPVKFGMTRQQVRQALGKPDKEEARGTSLAYLSRGYSVMVSPFRGVTMITCFTQQTFAIQVRDYQGKTTEGIAMGSRRDEVERAYGKPDRIEMNGPQTTYLGYRDRGLDFVLFNDKVVQFTLSARR